MKILLALLALVLFQPPSLQAQCPKSAICAGAWASVNAFRQNGLAVGTGTVALGELLQIQMAVCSYPWDFFHDSPMACFGGGQLALQCGSTVADLTPDDGVALIGPGSCGAVPFVRSRVMQYVVTPADVRAGRILLRGYYSGGVADLWSPTPIGAQCIALVRVRP